MLMGVDIVDVDTNNNDPQLCSTLACDIYQNLLIAEVRIFLFVYFFFFR